MRRRSLIPAWVRDRGWNQRFDDWRKEDKDIDLNLTTKLLCLGYKCGRGQWAEGWGSCWDVWSDAGGQQQQQQQQLCRPMDTCALSLDGRDLSPDTSNHPQKPRAKPTTRRRTWRGRVGGEGESVVSGCMGEYGVWVWVWIRIVAVIVVPILK